MPNTSACLRKAEAARQRAIAAQARLERIDTAKSVVRDTAIGAVRLVTDNVSMVANEALLMANETADTVTRSVQTVTGAVETAARTVLDTRAARMAIAQGMTPK